MSFGDGNSNYYLKDIPLNKAVSILDEWILATESSFEREKELIHLEDSVGRVVSETIYAKISSPIFRMKKLFAFILFNVRAGLVTTQAAQTGQTFPPECRVAIRAWGSDEALDWSHNRAH